jgi:ProP effector
MANNTTSCAGPQEVPAPAAGHAGRKQQLAGAVLELLSEKFPACFQIFEQRRRPLKVGIHRDIIAVIDGVTEKELGRALHVYVANQTYKSRLVAGADRIGLDGLPAGIVAPEEAWPPPPRKKTAVTVNSPAQAPSHLSAAAEVPSGPKRLSLAGLRAAAQHRRVGSATS